MKYLVRTLASLTLLLFIPSTLFAQPGIEWSKTYGGKLHEDVESIIQTFDGGYAVVGITESNDGDVSGSHGGRDIWVVKVDANGGIEWSKAYGGSGDDEASSIVQTADGGFVIAAWTGSNDGDVTGYHGSGDAWILKLSKGGSIEWERTYGGSAGEDAVSIVQTSDKGYVFSGESNSDDGDVIGRHHDRNTGNSGDVWVVKIDSIGDIEWSRCYGGFGFEEGGYIIQSRDGGYSVVGSTDSTSGDVTGWHPHGDDRNHPDIWVLKLAASGSIEWEHCYGGTESDGPGPIFQTVDGGYVVGGMTESDDGDVTGYHGGYGDAWVIKLDSAGAIQWERALGGSGQDEAIAAVQTEDRGYVIAASTRSNDGTVSGFHGGYEDAWLVKLDSVGFMVWEKTLGGSSYDVASSMVETSDGGIAMAGWTSSHDGDVPGVKDTNASDFWVVKLKGPDCSDIRVQLPRLQLQAHNQDTVRIPILAIDSSVRLLSVLDLSLHLNTDVLTPIGIDPHVGVFASAKQERFVFGGDSVSMRFQLSSAIGLAPDTLCVLECIAFVSDTLSTSVTLSRLNFEDPPFNAHCLTTQSIGDPDSGVQFTLIPVCGEQTLSKEMGKDDILTIASITPNPIRSEAAVQLHIPSGYANDGILEVYDALGNLLQKQPLVFSPLARSVTIPLSFAGSSGVRYIRISSKSGVSTGRVVVER